MFKMSRLLLVLVLVAATLVGCGTTNDQSTNGASNNTQEPSQSDNGTGTSNDDQVKEKVKIKMVYSRPIESLDDYATSVALAMGYFEEEGVDPQFEFAMGATDPVKLLATGNGDITFPSPSVLYTAASTGISDIISFYAQCPTYIFDFAVAADSTIETAKDLEGKKIVLGDGGWSVIADPLLVGLGVDPSKVEYVVSASQRAQSVVQGQADAALTWRMEVAEWPLKGLDIKRLNLHEELSSWPSNTFVVAKKSLEDPEKRDALIGFARAIAKGSYFAEVNPEAAARISLERFPSLGYSVEDATKIVEEGIDQSKAPEEGWGYHDKQGWEDYQQVMVDLGLQAKKVNIDDIVTNDYVDEFNDWDREKVKQDALNYQ